MLARRYIRAILRQAWWWFAHAARHNTYRRGGQLNQFVSEPYADEASSQNRAVRDRGTGRAENLLNAAQLVKASRPEVAQALEALAQRGD